MIGEAHDRIRIRRNQLSAGSVPNDDLPECKHLKRCIRETQEKIARDSEGA